MHLSAISLPRKQLSIENSACSGFFFFFLLDSGQFVVPPAFVWVVWVCPVCPVGEGKAGVGPLCWLSAQSARNLLTSCHLHSTDTPEFCAETVGSARVSMTAAVSELEDGEEEEDDDEAAAAPAEGGVTVLCYNQSNQPIKTQIIYPFHTYDLSRTKSWLYKS